MTSKLKLARWWCQLNRSEYPSDATLPKPYWWEWASSTQHKNDFISGAMAIIENQIGKKECMRVWKVYRWGTNKPILTLRKPAP